MPGEIAAATTATSAGPKGRHAPPAPARPHSPSSARRSASSLQQAPRLPHRPRVPATIHRSPIEHARASAPTGTTARPVPATDLLLNSPRRRRSTTSRLRPTLQRCPGAKPPGGTACPMESVDGLRPALASHRTNKSSSRRFKNTVFHEGHSFSVPVDYLVSKKNRGQLSLATGA